MKSRRKWIDPEDFHMMRCRAGLALPAAASLLDVTVRTVRNWERGVTKIPYTAYRLLKIVNGYVFTSQSWNGWFVRGDTLYSPTQRAFKPHELTYLSNYLWMARKWLSEHEQIRKEALVDAARHVDDNLQQTSSGERQSLLSVSETIAAPCWRFFATSVAPDVTKDREASLDLYYGHNRTKNTKNTSKTDEFFGHFGTRNNEIYQKGTTYTLCEVY